MVALGLKFVELRGLLSLGYLPFFDHLVKECVLAVLKYEAVLFKSKNFAGILQNKI